MISPKALLLFTLMLTSSLDCFAFACIQVNIQASKYAATSSGAVANSPFFAISSYQLGVDPTYSTNCAVNGLLNIFGLDQAELVTYKSNLTVISNHTNSITTLTNSLNTSTSDISLLKADNTTNKSDILTLKTDVQNLKNAASTSTQVSTTYDYPGAAIFYGAAFSSVFGLWIVSRMAGTVIEAVRRF